MRKNVLLRYSLLLCCVSFQLTASSLDVQNIETHRELQEQKKKRITGSVLDDTGEPVIGANVVEKGTTNGIITDIDGKFVLEVEENAILQISYIGYTAQEVTVKNQDNFTISLSENTEQLEEVVVIGYGVMKKSDLTGAVGSLNAEKLTEQRKTDVAQAVQGRMAGVDVRRINSKPGAPLSIKIRGNTVVTNNNINKNGVSDNLGDDLSRPLFVVDGIFMDNIDMLNPADIEKMDVLKDASATAIYGSRGANGVVIITTKSGVEGKTQFTYDGSFGVNDAAGIPDMMNGDRYVEFTGDYLRAKEWRGLVNNGNISAEAFNSITPDYNSEFVTEDERNNVANRNYTSWRDDYLKTGIQTSHTVGMSGGQNGLVYNASIGYLKDEGLMGIEAYERYNATTSLSKKITQKFTVGLKTYLAYSDRESGSKELFRSSLRLAPTVSSKNEFGEPVLFPDPQDGRFIHPQYDTDGAWTVNTRRSEIITNFFVDIKPAKWLSFKSTFAPNLSFQRYGEYRGLLTKSSRNDPTRIRAYYNNDYDLSYAWDNIADMDFTLTEGHKLKATLISSAYYLQQEGSLIENRNFNTDSHLFYNIGAGLDKREAASFHSKETLASFAARFNYNIHEKYLFTFTGRYDGSSKLAEGNKWAFFPSAAFAWRASEENFLKNVNWLDNLKLRLSYGESGNDKVIGPYNSMGKLQDTNYLFGTNITGGKTVASLPNKNLSWEVSKEYNFGIDLGIFNNRIRLSAEYYNKLTEGSILNREMMWVTGYNNAVGNFGSVRNKGVEIELNTVNINTADFTWETNLNFAKNINTIEEIDGEVDEIAYGDHGVLKKGEAIDAMYSYEKAGIWQMDEADKAAVYGAVPGMYKFVDQQAEGEEGHGVIDSQDKVVIGSHSPDWIGGMTNSFKYKNFDLSVMIYTRQGVFGHSEFYQNFAPYHSDGARFNRINLDYWTPRNINGEYPMPAVGDPGEWYFEDMSFIRIGNIGFGYNIPKNFLSKLDVANCRLSLDIQNPFTFSEYKGPDPETALQDTYNMGYSVRTILFGLKLTM